MTTKPTFEQELADAAVKHVAIPFSGSDICNSSDELFKWTYEAGANWAKAWCDERTKVLVDALEPLLSAALASVRPTPMQVKAAFDSTAQYKELTGVRD